MLALDLQGGHALRVGGSEVDPLSGNSHYLITSLPEGVPGESYAILVDRSLRVGWDGPMVAVHPGEPVIPRAGYVIKSDKVFCQRTAPQAHPTARRSRFPKMRQVRRARVPPRTNSTAGCAGHRPPKRRAPLHATRVVGPQSPRATSAVAAALLRSLVRIPFCMAATS